MLAPPLDSSSTEAHLREMLLGHSLQLRVTRDLPINLAPRSALKRLTWAKANSGMQSCFSVET